MIAILRHSEIVCKLYPNGEFTVGLDSSRRMEAWGGKPEKVKNMFWGALGPEAKSEVMELTCKRVLSFGLSHASKSPRVRRGLKGITTYGSRLVRNAAYTLQKENDKKNLSFVTLTLPGLSEEDMLKVCESWHSIVKDFFKSLKRLYERKSGRRFEYVGVTEIQEERYERGKGLGLHIHFVYAGRFNRQSNWILTYLEIRSHWAKTVSRHTSEKYNFDASENVQSVRKSAEGYLGKYISKGVKCLAKVTGNGDERYLPRAWYSVSRSLSRRVKQRVKRSRPLGTFLSDVIRRIDSEEFLQYWRRIEIETAAAGMRTVGYTGRFLTNKLSRTIIQSVDANCKELCSCWSS